MVKAPQPPGAPSSEISHTHTMGTGIIADPAPESVPPMRWFSFCGAAVARLPHATPPGPGGDRLKGPRIKPIAARPEAAFVGSLRAWLTHTRQGPRLLCDKGAPCKGIEPPPQGDLAFISTS